MTRLPFKVSSDISSSFVNQAVNHQHQGGAVDDSHDTNPDHLCSWQLDAPDNAADDTGISSLHQEVNCAQKDGHAGALCLYALLNLSMNDAAQVSPQQAGPQ